MQTDPRLGYESVLTSRGFYERHVKRLLDLLVAVPVAVVSAPVAFLVAIFVHREDRGPVLFEQMRVGRDGEPFKLRKFRTMPCGTANVPSAEAAGLRVTRVGRILRRTSLDEIPQIVSVLNGDMSLVGPRPPLPAQRDLVEMRQVNGSLRLKPGLTGLAQVNSYDGMPEREKAEWDGRYAAGVGLASDFGILLRTVGYLLHRPPQY